jgi:hypothetical protein
MPVDRRVIEEQLAALGEAERWWDQKELRDLPHVLAEDERIHALATGKVLMRPGRALKWLILVTSDRLVCLRADDRRGRRQLDVPIPEITSVSHRGGLRSTKIVLVRGKRKHRLRLAKADAQRVIAALAEQGATMPRTGYAFQYRAFRAPLPWGAMRRIQLLGVRPGPALPAAAPAESVTKRDLARLEDALASLENDVRSLQQQMEFIEQLLQQRSGALPFPTETPH